MNSKDFRKQLLGAGSALRVLAMVGAGVAATGIAVTPAVAQDYTSGSVTGTVTDESGAPVQGATVTLTSTSQGFTRTATTSANGAFRISALPTGGYDVTVEAAGKDTFTATDVRVLASQTASLNIGLTTTGNEIIVTGATIVSDFTGTTTGLNVDIEELVKTVPISRDLTSVVLLAPGTGRGDSAFGNLASIGGGSVAENAYYINGLNTTNFDNYLGSANVPFEFYRTIEVKAGGYPAEFGRATGGIVNATTKSGSNEFTAAAHLNWSPNFLRSAGKDEQNCSYDAPVTVDNPNPGITCLNSTNRSEDTDEQLSVVLEAGGPIIKDRLFVYGLLEMRNREWREVDALAGTAYDRSYDNPFWGVKVDAYPIDGHHLEFTIFDTQSTTTRRDVAYSEANGVPTYGLADSVSEFNFGGTSYVAKYTGNLTNFLTVSGAYGRMRDRFDNVGIAGAAGQPYFVNSSGSAVDGVESGAFFNGQRTLSNTFPYRTEREFFRGDVDLFFSLFGDHHIRGGFDVENNTLEKASVRTGGDFLVSNGILTSDAYNLGAGGAGAALIIRPGNVVEVNYFNSGGSFDAQNKSFYIQDEWDVTDRLQLSLGLRRDDFSVDRPDGANIVTMDENYAPRLGASYTLFDDYSGRIYGSFGDYYLPFASNTAFRTTGAEYYVRERYEYEGLDANGLPILGTQITSAEDANYSTTCPFQLTPISSGQFCNVTGDGSVASADTLISKNLSATKVREWLVGYEQTFRNVPLFDELKLGISYTNRRLKANAEDVAIDAAVNAYCDTNGLDCTTDGGSPIWTGFHQYVILNPGKDAVVQLDGLASRPGTTDEVTLTAEELGYSAASRKLDQVEFTFERPFDGSWTLAGSYTWQKLRGNSEGFVQSDFGQDDSGLTQDFDQPGFLDGAYGPVPQARRHRIKLWGSYQVFEGFMVGSNLTVESPRKLSCFGHHPTDPYANAYGAASRYCVPSNGAETELVARGRGLESDWIYNVDLKFSYQTEIPTGQTVRFRADIFNLLNDQGIQERNEVGELDATAAGADWYPVNPNYGVVTGYQTPRSVRLGVDIEF
ncbi:hypothetical protein FHS61_000225 [Altererythrobacter atlanticus]|uniref:TonB-dependent transporter Oar-like beta-barrel domain-containing protein n=1 Tax=Croceibacterium atlanticum TaxID=1267766 RepID=A0A0F7KUJ9_9SPHN|nr:TonB-dependent receptor [Croceibacterium atlanticum]AKH42455.1 hypothetical protein WYH_01414 [Croceibacterium atlanticum]MBB5731232.1 hypothetical protein [Croceibacterium atlanticum]